MDRWRARTASATHSILVVIGALLMTWPFAWLVISAFKSAREVVAYPPTLVPSELQWQNFPEAAEFLGAQAFANSVIFSVAVVVLQLALSITSGFALAKIPGRGLGVVLAVFVGTLFVPPQVTLIPTFLVTRTLDWLNTYPGLILPVVAQTGFGVFLFRQFFLALPDEIIAAARVDGASWPQVFWSIAAPLARAPIAAYTAVTFLTAWNMYVWPLVAATSQDLRVLPLALASIGTADSAVAPHIGMAATLLATLPVAAVFLIAQRSFVGGIAGSVKE